MTFFSGSQETIELLPCVEISNLKNTEKSEYIDAHQEEMTYGKGSLGV